MMPICKKCCNQSCTDKGKNWGSKSCEDFEPNEEVKKQFLIFKKQPVKEEIQKDSVKP